MDLVPCPEEETEWQGCASGEPWGEEVIPGHPEHLCCLFLPPSLAAAPG